MKTVTTSLMNTGRFFLPTNPTHSQSIGIGVIFGLLLMVCLYVCLCSLITLLEVIYVKLKDKLTK